MDNYDLEALYLYNDGWSYRIGKINKVNTKSISMEGGRKVLKENWNTVHKLTDEEVKIFNKELIKKLSGSVGGIKDILTVAKSLQHILSLTEFAAIDTSRLQTKLNELTELLAKEIAPFVLGDKTFEFDNYSERIVEVKEEI